MLSVPFTGGRTPFDGSSCIVHSTKPRTVVLLGIYVGLRWSVYQTEQIMRLPGHHRRWGNCFWLQISRNSVEQMYFMLLVIIRTGVHLQGHSGLQIVLSVSELSIWVTNTDWKSFMSQAVFIFVAEVGHMFAVNAIFSAFVGIFRVPSSYDIFCIDGVHEILNIQA